MRNEASKALFSKVTVRNQAVIPVGVRNRLGIRPGDTLRYRVTEFGIVIDKAPSASVRDPFALFSEWTGEADEKAFASL